MWHSDEPHELGPRCHDEFVAHGSIGSMDDGFDGGGRGALRGHVCRRDGPGTRRITATAVKGGWKIQDYTVDVRAVKKTGCLGYLGDRTIQ